MEDKLSGADEKKIIKSEGISRRYPAKNSLPVIKKPKKVAATVVLSCKKCKERCHHNGF